MAASDVYNALQTAISGTDRSIDLWGAANTASALSDLVGVLELFGIKSSYALTKASLSGDNASVTLTASGQFAAASAAASGSYAVAATLTYSDASRFALTLRVVDSRPWTFANFFPTLPASMRSNLDEAGIRGIRWTTSYLTGSRASYAVVVDSVSFSARSGPGGTLRMDGFLPEFADPDIGGKLGLLSPWPLRLSGTVVMPASATDFPLLQLVAQGSPTNSFSGSTVPEVAGPDPLNVKALFLEIGTRRLIRPMFGNKGMSSLALGGEFVIGGGLSGVIRTQILTASSLWVFHARFDPATSSLTQGLASLTRMFGVELPIPMDFPLLSEFHFAEVDAEFRNSAPPGQAPSFSLVTFALTITSNHPWTPPVPFVTFKDVGIRWVWGSTQAINPATDALESTYLLTGSVFGAIQFGGDGSQGRLPPPHPHPVMAELLPRVRAADGSVTIDLSLSIPSFYISANMRPGDYIPIGQAFAEYFDGKMPLVPADMNVTALSFTADPIGQVYQGQARILFGTPTDPAPEQAWTIMQVGTVGISLQRLEMWVEARGGRVGGGISGVFFLKGAGAEAYSDPQMQLSAEYPVQNEDENVGWVFAAHLFPGTSIDLTEMVARFIEGDPGYVVPEYVPHLLIDRLDATFKTGNGAYTFGGTASMRWTPTLFGTELSVNASASTDIARAKSGDPITGTLSGSFAVNKIAIMASMDIGVAKPTYLFKVMFGELWVQAVTSWRGEEHKRHQIVSVQLGGITLGDILEYLVNLAAPTLGFSLDPPWDLLKRVDLSRFVLTLDPQENVVEFVFNAEVDLGVMRVDTIGARYRRGTGQGKVELILTGNFFGEPYGSDKPLHWDVVNGSPPSVPGQGPSTVDLRFLGFGQRVTFAGATPDTVAASVAELRKAMQAPEPGKDPVGTGLVYAEDSQWLMGLEIGLIRMIDLGIIFNDPKLYGLSIALGGERAGSLAGLRFEILYKKITNDVGMYRIELRVPDAFRTIQLGAVSLTLGIVVIEIYTNGNFKIDLGFPYNRDYSRSFSLQAGIFIGRGGFYFGILDGDTSTSVPRITNGNFSPVIELGVGLAAGVGREISVGVLSGGAYVQIEVIFQGVLAWFNPTASGGGSAKFFRAQGVVAIHGKVYGKVDFVVVSASVTLEAFAQAMVVFESHRPLLLDFSVGVRAEASVKILFIRLHFSFSVTLDLSFTIGSASPTPWILANGGGSDTRSSIASTLPRHAQRKALLRHGALLRMRERRRARGLAAGQGGYVLAWKPTQRVFDRRQVLRLTMLPYITVGQVPVDWSGQVPGNADPQYRVAFLIYADTGMAADGKTAADLVERSVRLSSSDTLAADLLVIGLLRYALYALPEGPGSPQDSVNAAQLALLAEQIAMPQTATAGFGKDDVQSFFSTNLALLIGGLPSGIGTAEKGAMIFPMPPGLAWTSPQAGDRDFSKFNEIGADYQNGIRAILGDYFPVNGGGTDATDDPNDYVSFATCLFGDYCQLLVKAAVNAAQKQLENVPVNVTAGMSLADAARTFASAALPVVKEAGDTVQSVAARMGATTAELMFLNPPIQQTIDRTAVGAPLSPAPLIGVSPEMLVQDNAGTGLVQQAWPLGDVSRAVGSPDASLTSLSTLFNLADVTTLFAHVPPAGGYRLGANPNLLQEGRRFPMMAQRFTPPAGGGFDATQAGALFFVRYADPDLSQAGARDATDMPAWYAQAIAIINPGLSLATSGNASTVEIDPGTTLSVPTQYGNRSTTRAYVTVPGDTLYRIGCMLVLCQDAATLRTEPPLWIAFRNAVTAVDAGFGIPAWPLSGQTGGVAIQAGETAESLVRRMVISASLGTEGWSYDWSAACAWLAPAKVLSPAAVIVLPGATISDKQAFTFQSLADTYGLSLSDVAVRLQNQQGLLPDPTTLTVRQLPVMTVAQIEKGVLGESFAGVANQASQMLMAGLRLPGLQTIGGGHVVPDTTNPLPLYDLSGQQFTLPVSGEAGRLRDVALSLTVRSNVEWVSFGDTFTVAPEHDLASLQARDANLLACNSRLAAPDGLQPGMVLFAGVDDKTLDFIYTNAQILDQAPSASLKLTTVPATPPAPQALPLRGTAPNAYSFEHALPLQTPQVLPIPTTGVPLAGYATLWPFPQGLLLRAAARSSTPYDIFAGSQPGATVDNARTLPGTTYGCRLSFRIRRMDEGSSRFLLLGVDTDQRDTLLALRNEILGGESGSATKAYLGVSPAPNASNAQGLNLLDTSTPCFLIRTNLSTDSQPQPDLLRARAEDAPAPVYHADFVAQLADFLLLLWEGSVVGGTGYFLGFGKDLPGSAFDGQGVATLTLLAIAGRQQAAMPAGRTLEVFNNCLLVAPGLDGSIHGLYAECADDSDLGDVALTPPGTAGFMLTIEAPTGGDPVSALQDRYNTLAFWCADTTSPYTIAPAWTPALPRPSDGTHLQPWERQRLVRRLRAQTGAEPSAPPPPAPYWHYEQVVPFHRFATQKPLPSTQGLPSEANDPYRGFGGATRCPEPLLTFCMSDLLGNHSQGPTAEGQGVLKLTLGYTDPLIGLSQWPELAAYFEVLGQPGAASLAMQLGLKAASALPGASERGDGVIASARQQSEQYARIHYQLSQPNMQALLATSLRQGADEAEQRVDIGRLWRYAAGAHAYTATASQLQALTSPGQALSQLLLTHPVRYAEMALANEDIALNDLFAADSTLNVPVFMPYIAQRSLADLYAQRPVGWPDPGSPAALFALPENVGLPLAVGAHFKLPSVAGLSTGTDAATPSLADLASAHDTDAGRVGELNSTAAILAPMNGRQPDQPNVLSARFEQADGSMLTLQVTVVAGDTDSYAGVRKAFAAQGGNLSVMQIAAENAATQGLFKPNLTLSNDTYIAQPNDTPASNRSGFTALLLGTANASTPGIFDDGALVQFGSEALAPSDDTLGMIAQRYGCPADHLLSNNASLLCGDKLAVPGSFAWPAGRAGMSMLRVPYTVRAHDRLGTLRERFAAYSGDTGNATVHECVKANLNVPGTLARNVTIEIQVPGGNVSITTPAVASFAQALAQAVAINPDTTLALLADAIGSLPDALQPGALLLWPLACLPAATAPKDIAGLYGVDGASFALANTATPGLVAPQVELSLPGADGTIVEVTTKPNDTLNTVAVRFALAGVATDAGAIAQGNADAVLFAAQALALLPPVAVREEVSLGAGGPYPDTVFALDASLTLVRPRDLIHPDFDKHGPVAQASSPLAPRAQAGAHGGDSLNFGPFIGRLTDALPGLRVGTARAAGKISDLWCVDFTATGIASVGLVPAVKFPETAAMPRFFALAPLYDHLVTRQVQIEQLDDDGKLDKAGVTTNFMAIDAEPWAQRFLGDMDRFLGGPMATELYRIAALRDTLTCVIGSKAMIADGISRQLQLVFDYSTCRTSPDPDYQEGLAIARDALKQQLYVSLLNAYDTSVVVQYDTTSNTPWSKDTAPPVSLYGQARLTGTATPVTFAASKTTFDPARAFVSFFATVADPERHSWVRGTLDYAYSHAEFAITSKDVPTGYQASNWLSFLPLQNATAKPEALKNTNPGDLLAPVPLRTYPLLPSIREQTAHVTYRQPSDLSQLALWTYRLTCSHQFAAQDSVRIVTDFNLAPAGRPRAAATPVDLFGALAQYTTVADKLWTLLGAPVQQPPSPTFINAAKTFADLAHSIAGLWNLRLAQDESSRAPEDRYTVGASYAFNARVKYSEDGKSIESFSLTREQDQPGPGQAWPTVEVMIADGAYAPLKIRLPATPGATTVYAPEQGVTIPAHDQQTFRLAWEDIGIAAFQNARARMLAVRNNHLLYDPERPQNPDLPTSSAFLFKTAEITATSIVTPLIERSAPQKITGEDLTAALDDAIQTLFPTNGLLQNTTASWGVFYTYQLVLGSGPDESLVSKLPVALYPSQPLAGAAQALADAVQTWTHNHHPATQGGGWLFDVILYSGVDNGTRPLFTAELSYKLGGG